MADGPGAVVTGTDDIEKLRVGLARAVFLAQHIHAMVDTETWRSAGGDDGQGHFEGDYWAEQVSLELRELHDLAGAVGATSADETDFTRPRSCPREGSIPAWDAGWNAQRIGLARETVRVVADDPTWALLGYDVRAVLALTQPEPPRG